MLTRTALCKHQGEKFPLRLTLSSGDDTHRRSQSPLFIFVWELDIFLSYFVLFIFPDEQSGHVSGQHVLQQQPVQVFPGLDLVLLRVVLVLEHKVLAEAGLVLAEWKSGRVS